MNLTQRQKQILKLLAQGLSCKQIAWELNISSKTVETHIQKIRDGHNCHCVALLTRLAIREGLVAA